MSSPPDYYEKTQNAKNTLKNLLKSGNRNIKSLIQKKPNDASQNPTRQIISLSQICCNLKQYGPASNFVLDPASSRESSPSLSQSEEQIPKNNSNLTIKDVNNLLFETYQIEFSEDFQRLSQILMTLEQDKLGLIVTNVKIRKELEALRVLILNSAYHPELSFLKMMYFKSKPAIIIKLKRMSDIFIVLNFLNTNKAVKQMLGNDLKVLWFRYLEQKIDSSKVVLRNLPPNFNAAMIKKFISDTFQEIEVKFIEDPMYYKGQVSTIMILENFIHAENLIRQMNNYTIQERYIVKVHLHPLSSGDFCKSAHFKDYFDEKSDIKNQEFFKLITEKLNSRKRKAETSLTKQLKDDSENSSVGNPFKTSPITQGLKVIPPPILPALNFPKLPSNIITSNLIPPNNNNNVQNNNNNGRNIQNNNSNNNNNSSFQPPQNPTPPLFLNNPPMSFSNFMDFNQSPKHPVKKPQQPKPTPQNFPENKPSAAFPFDSLQLKMPPSFGSFSEPPKNNIMNSILGNMNANMSTNQVNQPNQPNTFLNSMNQFVLGQSNQINPINPIVPVNLNQSQMSSLINTHLNQMTVLTKPPNNQISQISNNNNQLNQGSQLTLNNPNQITPLNSLLANQNNPMNQINQLKPLNPMNPLNQMNPHNPMNPMSSINQLNNQMNPMNPINQINVQTNQMMPSLGAMNPMIQIPQLNQLNPMSQMQISQGNQLNQRNQINPITQISQMLQQPANNQMNMQMNQMSQNEGKYHNTLMEASSLSKINDFNDLLMKNLNKNKSQMLGVPLPDDSPPVIPNNIPLPNESPPKMPSRTNSPSKKNELEEMYGELVDNKEKKEKGDLKEKQKKRKAFFENLKKGKNMKDSELLDDI